MFFLLQRVYLHLRIHECPVALLVLYMLVAVRLSDDRRPAYNVESMVCVRPIVHCNKEKKVQKQHVKEQKRTRNSVLHEKPPSNQNSLVHGTDFLEPSLLFALVKLRKRVHRLFVHLVVLSDRS